MKGWGSMRQVKLFGCAIIFLCLVACSSGKEQDVAGGEQSLISGHKIIDELITKEVKNGDIIGALTKEPYEVEDIMTIKVINDVVIVLLRNENERSCIEYIYENGELRQSGSSTSNNNSDSVGVTVGLHSSHDPERNEMLSYSEVILNEEKLVMESKVVEIYFTNGVVTRELISDRAIIVPILLNRIVIDEDLLLKENEKELAKLMESYEFEIDYLLLKDENEDVVYDSRISNS